MSFEMSYHAHVPSDFWMHLKLVLLSYKKYGCCEEEKRPRRVLTPLRILETFQKMFLHTYYRRQESGHMLDLFLVTRQQLLLYFSANNIIEFGVNLLFFYKYNVLKDCLHLDAFIWDIQQALQGVISKKCDEMKLGINERLIKYSLSI